MDTDFAKHHECNPTTLAVPLTAFEILKERTLTEIAALGNSYHNRFHTEERVMPACEEYAREARLSPRDSQKLAFGALFHDFGHIGHTYRQLVDGADEAHLSNEEFAGMHAVTVAVSWFPQHECDEIRSLIHASTHGQDRLDELPPEHAVKLYRAYKPETDLEKILVLADVSGFRWGTESYLRDGIKLIGESSFHDIPGDFAAFLERAKHFIPFIQRRIDQAAHLFPEYFATKLSEELHRVHSEIVALSDPASPLHNTWRRAFLDARTAQLRKLDAA